MGSIEGYSTASGRRYRVRYRTPDRRQTDKRGFKSKREAELFLATVEVSKARGEFIDATASRESVSALGALWLSHQSHLKPSSLRPVESAWRLHVEPKWGNYSVGSIRHSDVQAWVTGLTKTHSATSVLRAYGVIAGILDVAVRERRVQANQARGVNLPRKTGKRRIYLSHAQVQTLAERAGKQTTLVLFLAYTGLRWGEATGLRLRDLDPQRRRVQVTENAVVVGGHIVVGTPKSHQGRSVPFPEFLSPHLATLCEGKGIEDLVFGDGKLHVRTPDSRRGWFVSGVRKSQLVDRDFPALTIHDLRHTAASLAISAGANVKAVQRMLGHASAAMRWTPMQTSSTTISTPLLRPSITPDLNRMWAKRGQATKQSKQKPPDFLAIAGK